MFGLWAESACGDRDVGARGCGSGLLRVPKYGSARCAPPGLCGMRSEGRANRAGAEQGVEAINGNIRMLINRGRGFKNLRYLLLKAQRMVATKTEFVAFRKTA